MERTKGVIANTLSRVRGIKNANDNSIDDEEIVPAPTKRIVVVGATGAGKSTSLNVIATMGEEMVFQEAPHASVLPQTINANEYELPETLYNQRIVLVDSPGINDTLDYDLQRKLLNRLQVLDDIAVVVFCCPFNVKMTPEFKETIHYYARVFEPVMRDGRFGLFFTHLNGDRYQQMVYEQKLGGEKISDMLVSKANAISKEFNIQFSFAWLMGKIFPYQVESVQQEHELYEQHVKSYYNRQRSMQEHTDESAYRHLYSRNEVNSVPYPRSIGCMSLETRKNLLNFVVRTNCTSLKNHSFPLPPAMEIARRMAVNVVDRLLKMKEETIRVTQPRQSELLAMKTASVKLELAGKQRIQEVERDIESLESEQSCTYAKGMDNIIEFMRYANEVQKNIPIEPRNVVKTLYQCEIDNTKYDAETKQYVFDVVPNFFNLFRNELDGEWHRWFCHLTFKWDGKLANKDKIQSKRQELDDKKLGLDAQVAKTEEITRAYGQNDKDMKSHEEHRKQLTDDLECLQQSLFKLTEFSQIDQTLSRYQEAFATPQQMTAP